MASAGQHDLGDSSHHALKDHSCVSRTDWRSVPPRHRPCRRPDRARPSRRHHCGFDDTAANGRMRSSPHWRRSWRSASRVSRCAVRSTRRIFQAAWHVTRRINETDADVIHGHGAKAGAYARLAFPRKPVLRAYTPHGGSLLLKHNNLSGRMYLTLEKMLLARRALYLFESAYSGDIFREKIGTPNGIVRVIHNGVSKQEFEPVTPAPDATDLVFMGEFRAVKGIDVLIDAIALLRERGRSVTATFVGNGPDEAALAAHVERLSLTDAIRFASAMPARHVLTLGRVMVIPSYAESTALCGAGNGGRRHAADHHECRRHSGNLWPVVECAGAARQCRSARPMRSNTRSPTRPAAAKRAQDLRARVAASSRKTAWSMACCRPICRRLANPHPRHRPLLRSGAEKRRLLFRRVAVRLFALFRLLKFLQPCLQGGERRFHRSGFVACSGKFFCRGIQFLSRIAGIAIDEVLQEIDIRLQAGGAALHLFFRCADFEATHVLRVSGAHYSRADSNRKNAPYSAHPRESGDPESRTGSPLSRGRTEKYHASFR